jgi:lambda repressor-like predicted transcriptional regulator
MKLTDLKNLNEKIRSEIKKHLKKEGITLHQFCKKVGVHQSQMWIYLYSDNKSAGLHSKTLEKIGNSL